MPMNPTTGPRCRHGKFLECPTCLRALIESAIAILVQILGEEHQTVFERIESRVLCKLRDLTQVEPSLNADVHGDVDGDEIIRRLLG